MSRSGALSLRARLLAGIALVAVVLIVVSAIVTATTRSQLIDQVDSRLVSLSGSRIPDFDRMPDGDQGRTPPALPPPELERISDVYEGSIGSDGELVARFIPTTGSDAFSPPDVTPDDLPADGNRLFTADSVDGGATFRVLARVSGDRNDVTAVPLDDVESTIRRLIVVEVLGSLAILAALGLVGWWVLRLGIRPINEMTETASRIAGGDLDVRIPETAAGTEAGELAIALNRMLGTIGDALDERAAGEERLRRFVADASHELRTPVTTIRGYAELYRHGGLADDAALDDAMRRTEQEAVRMGRLVEDMLVLAKLDEDRPLEQREIDVGAVVTDAAADARVVDATRPVEVEVAGGRLTVVADEDRLRQVLANLVGNALVHTEPGTPIELRARRDADDVVIEVEDHGAGMAPDVVDRVTERFYRADPARSRHRGGSGLGLSIVDATVRAHGGRVEIDSVPGSGTTVRLVVPVVPRT